MTENKYKDSLDAVNNTISSYDNKASVLLTAVGVVFGFSMFSTQELASKSGTNKTFVIIIGVLYLLSFLVTIVSLVMIVFPRGRNKKERAKQIDHPLYSEDLYKHTKTDDLEDFLSKCDKDGSEIEQIKICTRIAHIKGVLLRTATISIVIFSFLLVSLVVLLLA